MLKTSLNLILLALCLTSPFQSFAQHALPGFRGWVHSSTPPNQIQGASSILATNFNRAHLNWYVIDPAFYFGNTPFVFPESDLSNHYTRQVTPSEVFPLETNITGENLLRTFDLRYIPDRPGPHNYDVLPTNTSAGIDSEGNLLAPETRWAGIMRQFACPDLPSQGIDSIDFWLMNPFIYNPDHEGLTLTFQLGEVSEDVLRDGKLSFEYGNISFLDSTVWGWHSFFIFSPREFPDSEELRTRMDVGLDGLSDENERLWFDSYLDLIEAAYGPNSNAYQKAWEDPSRDNFQPIDDPSIDMVSIADRHLGANGMEGNSAILEHFYNTNGYSKHPNSEDLNLNEALDTHEETEDYVLRLEPGMGAVSEYIVDSNRADIRLVNGGIDQVTWYHFRLPLVKQGSNLTLGDFQNVPSVRLLISDCSEPVTLRFVDSEILNIDYHNPRDPAEEEPQVLPYPNPFDQELRFKMDDKEEWPTRLEIWDTQGQLVEDHTYHLFFDRYYPRNRLVPGVYVFRLTTVNALSGATRTYNGRVLKRDQQ